MFVIGRGTFWCNSGFVGKNVNEVVESGRFATEEPVARCTVHKLRVLLYGLFDVVSMSLLSCA